MMDNTDKVVFRKQVSIGDLFTDDELQRAFKIIDQHSAVASHGLKSLNTTLLDEVVTDAMPRIDQTTGQKNDPAYMAYVLQYAHMQLAGKR